MNLSINAPLSWKTTLSFITLATLLILLTGWLTMSGSLPIKMNISYSNWESNFIQFWVGVAILIGILLPGTAFFVLIRHSDLRKVLSLYLFVLIIQIMTEQVLSSMFFPSIVVTIGTIYTAFRLWQLWQSQQLVAATTQLGIRSRWLLGSLLWLMLLFWLSNLIMLLVLAWPSIL